MTDIEKLQKIIRQIDYLLSVNVTTNDPEFKEWHSRTERFLHNKYGADSIELKEFQNYTFIPKLAKTPRDKNFLRILIYDSCHKDLKTIQNLFLDYLQEMKDAGEKAAHVNHDEEEVERIFKRFKQVAVQLTRRHSGRDTILIQDEYDVQDLLRALLSLYFDDVRAEESTPSYAGSSLRIFKRNLSVAVNITKLILVIHNSRCILTSSCSIFRKRCSGHLDFLRFIMLYLFIGGGIFQPVNNRFGDQILYGFIIQINILVCLQIYRINDAVLLVICMS